MFLIALIGTVTTEQNGCCTGTSAPERRCAKSHSFISVFEFRLPEIPGGLGVSPRLFICRLRFHRIHLRFISLAPKSFYKPKSYQTAAIKIWLSFHLLPVIKKF